MGIPKDSILQYETALTTGKFVLIAHGSAMETAQGQKIIDATNPEASEAHQPSCASPEPCLVGV